MDQTILLTLRLVHIVTGVFWVGGTVLLAAFLIPTVRELGPGGGRVMQLLVQRRRLPVYMNIAGGLAMLSGIIMYWSATAATNGAWAGSRPGIGFGVGAVAAILGAIVGGAGTGRAARRMARLGETIQAAGGPPTPEQSAEVRRLQDRIAATSRAAAALLVTAAAAMAVARYL